VKKVQKESCKGRDEYWRGMAPHGGVNLREKSPERERDHGSGEIVVPMERGLSIKHYWDLQEGKRKREAGVGETAQQETPGEPQNLSEKKES